MFKKLINWYSSQFGHAFNPEFEFGEGLYADEYSNEQVKQLITEKYNQRWAEPVETPVTHPWKFNPLKPPVGWRYDPQYEWWDKVKEN